MTDGIRWKTYEHPEGLFSLEIPSTWRTDDDSKGDMVMVNFVAPAADMLVRLSMNSFPEDQEGDEGDILSDELERFVQAVAGRETNFVLDEIEEDEEGTFWLSYSYESNDAEMLGDAAIWSEGDFYVIYAMAYPDQENEEYDEILEHIGDSLAIAVLDEDEDGEDYEDDEGEESSKIPGLKSGTGNKANGSHNNNLGRAEV